MNYSEYCQSRKPKYQDKEFACENFVTDFDGFVENWLDYFMDPRSSEMKAGAQLTDAEIADMDQQLSEMVIS
jgi:hypothetical protein